MKIMKTYTLRYKKDDPPCKVLEMSRFEFETEFPESQIIVEGKVIANVGGEIQCDSCMNDPGKTIFVIYGPYGQCYCGKCFKRDFAKYCTEQTKGE